MRRGFESCSTPLEREEAAAAHNRGVDLFIAIPAIEATVRVKNSG
jgi:hypothetical protein